MVQENTAYGGEPGGGITVLASLAMDSCFVTLNTGSEGGGIYSGVLGTVSIVDSTIAENIAGYGGGIQANTTFTVTNTTISGNAATTCGGGISEWNSADVTLINTTVTDNGLRSGGPGSAICNSRPFHVVNTILAGPQGGNVCSANVTSSTKSLGSDNSCGVEIEDADPGLGPLQDNGGLTPTHALLADSPVIDKGSNPSCPALDQRGTIRPIDGDRSGVAACDLGAYERKIESYMPLVRK